MKIKNVIGREVLDSRGNPTVEVDVILENNIVGRAIVPSGASTGEREALEMRDGGSRYNGLGVLKAVNNVNTILKDSIVGMDVFEQQKIDYKMIDVDGTPNKSNLGANAILGVSMAVLKAAANCDNMQLYKYVGNGTSLPVAMMNILNGGCHADNNLDFQEFMIVPNRDSIHERVRVGAEVFHTLKKLLKEKGYFTGVGDEGGFAPNLSSNEEAFQLIIEAIKMAGYIPGKDVNLAIDVAASELYENGKYNIDGKGFTTEELIEYYDELINKYPIISIEDPLDQNDWDGFADITKRLKDRVQIVGDDLFVTNKKYLENLGQEENYCLTVDCYPSVDDEILDLIKEIYKPDFVIKSEDVFYEKDELNKMMKPFLTENRVRGVMYYGKMDDFIDDIKLAQY